MRLPRQIRSWKIKLHRLPESGKATYRDLLDARYLSKFRRLFAEA